MAGRGPLPKPPEQRRNRTPPRLGEVRTASGTGWQHGRRPSPPEGLGRATDAAWRRWFGSWWAAFWTPDDLPGLCIVAQLHDAVSRGDTRLAGELRQWQHAYGITPAGRLSLRWAPPRQPGEPGEPVDGAGPYSHLRSVPETVPSKGDTA